MNTSSISVERLGCLFGVSNNSRGLFWFIVRGNTISRGGEGMSADSSIVMAQERLGQWEVEILQEVGYASSEVHFLQLGSSSQRFSDLSRQ